MDDLLKNKTLDQHLLKHLIAYHGMDKFKRLFNIRYRKEIQKGGKGFIPNRVLRQMVNMEIYYSPYKKDKSDGN